MNTARRRLLGTVMASAALVVGGCSFFGDDADEEEATALADTAAAALTAGQMGEVAWTEDGELIHTRWDQIAGDLISNENLTLTVEAAEVRMNDDDTATATLSLAWDLGGHEWAYETTLPMVKIEDQWRAEFSPAVIEPSLQDGEALAASTIDAVRADIVGTDGTALVTDRPVVRVGIDKVNVDAAEVDESARSLADLVGVDADAYARRVSDAGERAFVEAITLRDEDVTTEVRQGIDAISGGRGIADEIPLAPTRTFARPLLGTVGPATAEVIETADGAIGEGDVVGLSGLQRQYDETLRGAPGIVVRAVADEENTNDASDDGDDDVGGGDDGGDGDDSERELFTAQPVDGTPLTVTLHAPTQILAEEVLAGADGAAALVAMRPSDGHLLAVAGTSPDGYSIATLGQYAPGSTFKTVTALALLRAGLVPESKVSCPPTITVDGYRFKNYDDYPSSALGDIDLRTAVAESCNTALIGARDTATQSALAQAAGSLGLGLDHDLGFPAYLGSVPAEAEGTAHAAAMIGQGEVLASPLAMAAVAASVAAGQTVTPVLVPEAAPEPAAPPAPLTDDEATLLRNMMRAAVTDGSARFLAELPGEPVIAKTGTAEYGTGDDLGTHAWMIAARGDLAVAVFVENGESGSATAGPLLTTFLQAASV